MPCFAFLTEDEEIDNVAFFEEIVNPYDLILAMNDEFAEHLPSEITLEELVREQQRDPFCVSVQSHLEKEKRYGNSEAGSLERNLLTIVQLLSLSRPSGRNNTRYSGRRTTGQISLFRSTNLSDNARTVRMSSSSCDKMWLLCGITQPRRL